MQYTLKALLDDHQTGHSEFQDDYLITVKAGGNVYGQYKQALRELYRRVRGYREIYFDLKVLEVDIAEHKANASIDDENNFDGLRNHWEFKRKTMQIEEAERALKDTKRELIRFYQQADYFKVQINENHGQLTNRTRRTLDRAMWFDRMKMLIAVDLVAHSRISRSTLEAVISLPREMKDQIIPFLRRENHDKMIKWMENYHNADSFPELDGDGMNIELIEEQHADSD